MNVLDNLFVSLGVSSKLGYALVGMSFGALVGFGCRHACFFAKMAATEETPLCVQQRAPQPKGAYVLIIKVEFKKGTPSPSTFRYKFIVLGLKQEFLNQWQPLAEYVRLHEPNTLTYELAHDTADPDVVFIYERYSTLCHAHIVVACLRACFSHQRRPQNNP